MSMREFLAGSIKNLAKNALTDKDGDFCPGTTLGIATAVVSIVQFVRKDSTDFSGLCNAVAVIIAAIAAKRWSENR